jgi:hypothetical protein
MPKLRLKRTPAEETEHQLRKARKAARKAAKRRRSLDDLDDHWQAETRKRRREHGDVDQDEFTPNSTGRDDDSGEDRFKEKLFGAYEDDDRLFSLEDRLNDYAHVPRRWRGGPGSRTGKKGHSASDDDNDEMDPQYMSDERYAEWVRAGMWRSVLSMLS